MTNKVSRIAIMCSLEETIRDEVRRMCDTDSLAELDTMALHAKENIKMLQSVKYKSLVKESTEVVKELVKDEPQTCSFSDCDNFKNPDYERCIKCKRKQIKLKTEPQTEMPRCSVNGTPYDECGFCEYFKCEADVPQTERSE